MTPDKSKEKTKTIHVRETLHTRLKKVSADRGQDLRLLTELALEKTYKKELAQYQ